MSDTTLHLQLPGAQLERIERADNERITLHFSRVHLIQKMEGAFEDSLWSQAVRLVLQDCTPAGDLPACPCELQGGELTNNIYTWRNEVPLPINWRGETGCKLVIAGSADSVIIHAGRMTLEQLDHPRYIRHIRKG